MCLATETFSLGIKEMRADDFNFNIRLVEEVDGAHALANLLCHQL